MNSIAASQIYTGDDDEMWTASFLFPSMIELKHSIMSLFPSNIESGVITVHEFFVHGEGDDVGSLCSLVKSKEPSMWWLGPGLVIWCRWLFVYFLFVYVGLAVSKSWMKASIQSRYGLSSSATPTVRGI